MSVILSFYFITAFLLANDHKAVLFLTTSPFTQIRFTALNISLNTLHAPVMQWDASVKEEMYKSFSFSTETHVHIFDAEVQSANVSFGRFLALNSYLAVDQSSISQPRSGTMWSLKDFRCWTNTAEKKRKKEKALLWFCAELFRRLVHHQSKTEERGESEL